MANTKNGSGGAATLGGSDSDESLTLNPNGDGGKGANSVPENKKEPVESGIDIASLAAAHSFAGFDPSKHAANPDGSPKMKADGVTYALRRGRKAGGDVPVKAPSTTKKVIEQAMSAQQCAMTAIPIVMTIEKVAMAFDRSFEMSPDEKDMHVSAWSDYLTSVGITKPDPFMMLCIVQVSYLASRANQETVRQKFAKMIGAGSSLVGRIFKRFA